MDRYTFSNFYNVKLTPIKRIKIVIFSFSPYQVILPVRPTSTGRAPGRVVPGGAGLGRGAGGPAAGGRAGALRRAEERDSGRGRRARTYGLCAQLGAGQERWQGEDCRPYVVAMRIKVAFVWSKEIGAVETSCLTRGWGDGRKEAR